MVRGVVVRKRAFWFAAGLLTYTYGVFPVILAIRGRLARRPVQAQAITPAVTIIVAARNEEASIGRKLRNIEELDYPNERLEVIIASDGSDDRTEDLVAAHAGRRITLLKLPRNGKAAALNAAVAAASGEILVFSDANSQYVPAAIRELVAPFADASVGGVAGNQVYARDAGSSSDAEGERAYWNIDRLLKRAESQAGSAVSATGAIYAIRRSLFDPIPPGVTDDFYTSVGVIAKGQRLVFAPRAMAYERPAGTGRLEFRRKVRIMTRGLAAIVARRELLNPRRHGFYAVQLFSHKVMRRHMTVPLATCSVLAPTLWRHGRVYRLATTVEVVFYLLAVGGLARWRMASHPVFSLPAFICSALAASAVASWNVLLGRRIDRWEPVHTEADAARIAR